MCQPIRFVTIKSSMLVKNLKPEIISRIIVIITYTEKKK